MSSVVESPAPVTGPSGIAALEWILETLWGMPGGARASAVRLPQGARTTDTFAVLPSAAHPRLLLPLRSRRAASHALREYTPGKTSVRMVKPLLTWGMRSGLAQPLLRDRVHVGVDEHLPAAALAGVLLKAHLEEVLGRQDLELAVKFDAPRPQRKPILHILDRKGRPLGFAKVGWNELTRPLVRNEVRVLEQFERRARPLREFSVPRLLHSGRWRDLELMVVAPVSLGARRRFLACPPMAANDELAGLDGVDRMPLAASPFWERRRRRISATADRSPQGLARLAAASQAIADRYGDVELAFGTWHGDWVPWNMGRRDGRLHVWDWERGGELAPLGLDAVHFDYQAELGLRKTRPDVAAHAPLLLSLHLLEMALRFDEARAAGVDTTDPKYLPALQTLLAAR
jgi:hypothetical protein